MSSYITFVKPPDQRSFQQYLPFTLLELMLAHSRGFISIRLGSKTELVTMKMADEDSYRLTIPSVCS